MFDDKNEILVYLYIIVYEEEDIINVRCIIKLLDKYKNNVE